MTTTIKLPRGHNKRLKAFDSLQEVNRWGSDVDARIDEIIQSLGSTQRAIREITRTTGAASLGLHAPTHRPGSGSDPLATAAPTSTLGGTSSNAVGVGTSFARNDHSHDVGTAAPAFVLGTAASEGSSNNLARVDAGIALFDTTDPAALAGTAAPGSVAFSARRDHVHLYPVALRSTANDSTLTLTDGGADQTLTGSTGVLNIVPGTGVRISFPNSADATLVIAPNTTTAASFVVSVQGRPAAGTRTLMLPNWFQPLSTDVFTSQTFRTWDVQMSFVGQHTGSTFVGYDASTSGANLSSGSGLTNNLYVFRAQPFIGSGFGGFAEAMAAYFRGPRRSLTSYKADVLAAVIVEPPTGCNKKTDGTTDVDQVGILIRQQTAQGTAPTNRVGLDIEAQNTGTNRYAIRTATDTSLFAGITLRDATDIVLNATTGSKIGTATTQKLGFWNKAPVVQPAAYTPTNVTTDRAYDANATTLNEIADVLGTLITDLQSMGLVG